MKFNKLSSLGRVVREDLMGFFLFLGGDEPLAYKNQNIDVLFKYYSKVGTFM